MYIPKVWSWFADPAQFINPPEPSDLAARLGSFGCQMRDSSELNPRGLSPAIFAVAPVLWTARPQRLASRNTRPWAGRPSPVPGLATRRRSFVDVTETTRPDRSRGFARVPYAFSMYAYLAYLCIRVNMENIELCCRWPYRRCRHLTCPPPGLRPAVTTPPGREQFSPARARQQNGAWPD